MMAAPRDIQLTIRLAGGHVHTLTLREDAPELLALFTALATPEAGSRLVQLPLDGGRSACSFQTAQLVSIVSDPPVLTQAALLPAAAPGTHPALQAATGDPASQLRRPRYVVVDDFLSAKEHDELLAYALMSEAQFEPGSVTSYESGTRLNQVILGFGESVHSRLLQNRLLVWLPLLSRALGIPSFPLAMVESQLTAAGQGHFFKVHADDAPDLPRVLSCVYYLHREPRGFAGGDLRLYDCIEEGDSHRAAETYTAIEPRANRMVVFPSGELHEAMPVRCPSREFADSRFAVTSWLHRAARDDAQATFGWGHFHCAVVAPQFAAQPGDSTP